MVFSGAWRTNRAGLRPRAGLVLAALLVPASGCAAEAAGPPLTIQYLERRIERPVPLNNEDPIPDDEGARGAELGLKDSNATGRFIGLSFSLESRIVQPGDDIRAAFRDLANPRFVVVNAPAEDVLAIADLPEARSSVLLNIGAPDTRLRDADCRKNLLHVLPSRAMLADALVQFLALKRWSRILLVAGPAPGDALYAEALRRSAKKFGARIVAESSYDPKGGDVRDTALREFALPTRGAEHDVVAVADEAGEFGASLNYNTASPRPLVGTQGLSPAAWGRPVEAWAAVQLQGRFRKLAGRAMRPVDWAGWMAVHAIGEASVKARSTDPEAVRAALTAPNFEVGGFKGRPLSFRAWDGQLRQPVFLLWPGAVTATAPIEGFLHHRTELDTLGLDEPESVCRAFTGRAG
ncbi:ABC transporter, substrate binding protein, PQQ-dependent alcohol dehydrogenase system [Methylobacterium phyllostachyos]|uniref:ABC transporter, substrate binding protein, PQQ-dependent alcohol dehydrogenase system n=1 Tax=Methylobacterium phyllostachyos TaxID=582672 RepID=A0A1H0IHP6_9HYPH|nr:ABC transporter substrate-binding protein [Methylobacterium phyllostachyos]SDO30800.1 ABC transporter, substrate binding protein, PQQ-dependent alcohol dehydrogenase system [Methylobacterium phyllostachyos]